MSKEYKERADRILAELIDELVYEERQRILVEERLGVRIQELETLSRDLVLCVQSLCGYTLTIEGQIVPFLSTAARHESTSAAVSEKRTEMVRTVAAVSEVVGSPSDRLLQPTSPLLFQSDETAIGRQQDGGSSAADETEPRGHSTVRDERTGVSADRAEAAKLARALLDSKKALLAPLTELRNVLGKCVRRAQGIATLPSSTPRADIDTEEASKRRSRSPLAGELHDLRRQVETLEERLREEARERSHTRESGAIALVESRDGPSVLEWEDRVAALESKRHNDTAKIRAFEMTVEALNQEVSVLQDNNAKAAHAHSQEMDRLREQQHQLTTEYESKLAECDTALCRISMEMEQLIVENARLKKQIRVWQPVS